MTEGEISAWHYATRKPVCVRWKGGKIIAVEKASHDLPRDSWIVPALFDVQVNGYGGIDFQQDNLTSSDLLKAIRALRRDGCASILLTLITDEWTKLTARLRHLKELRDKSKELREAIVGWHVEGPFLSEQPGFHGAHDPRLMIDPTPAHVRELREIASGDPLLLTISPERNGAIEAIQAAVSMGSKVSLGHTNASTEILRKAVAAGANSFTHLGNGCPRELDRHDNILWRVFEAPRLFVSVIPDKVHVSSPAFRLFHRLLDSIYYTTDAMSAAGAAPGRYTIGKLEVEVGADQIVRQPGKTNFAGSALRPIDGVFRAAEMLNRPWQETWARFSETPARLMGLSCKLEAGEPANFCVLKFSGDRFAELKVVTASAASA